MRAGAREKRAPDFRRLNGRGRLKLAPVHQQFDKATQNFIVRARAHVFFERVVKLTAGAPLVLREDAYQLARVRQVIGVASIYVSRRATPSALPALRQISRQHKISEVT